MIEKTNKILEEACKIALHKNVKDLQEDMNNLMLLLGDFAVKLRSIPYVQERTEALIRALYSVYDNTKNDYVRIVATFYYMRASCELIKANMITYVAKNQMTVIEATVIGKSLDSLFERINTLEVGAFREAQKYSNKEELKIACVTLANQINLILGTEKVSEISLLAFCSVVMAMLDKVSEMAERA